MCAKDFSGVEDTILGSWLNAGTNVMEEDNANRNRNMAVCTAVTDPLLAVMLERSERVDDHVWYDLIVANETHG